MSKKQNLNVTVVQMDILWQQPQANRHKIAGFLKEAGPTDLVLLPEMFTTGFTMDSVSFAETMEGPTLQWMKQIAATIDAAIAGSVIIKEQGNFFNRLLWVKPDGQVHYYDKRHLFRMAGEHKAYTAGQVQEVMECKGWRIRPQVCYDLRFPVWSRNAGLEYDVLIYLANWPARRIAHWDTLLAARAIENQCYCIGVNRTGTDGESIAYPGQSAVRNFLGEAQWQAGEAEAICSIALQVDTLNKYREKFPVWKDRDQFNLMPG